jgi:hypothetical protein
MAAGQPTWLASLQRSLAGLLRDHGPGAAACLAVVLALVAVGVFLPRPAARAAVFLAVGVAAAIWLAEGLGGLLGGMGTDPNSGRLLPAAARGRLAPAPAHRLRPRWGSCSDGHRDDRHAAAAPAGTARGRLGSRVRCRDRGFRMAAAGRARDAVRAPAPASPRLCGHAVHAVGCHHRACRQCQRGPGLGSRCRPFPTLAPVPTAAGLAAGSGEAIPSAQTALRTRQARRSALATAGRVLRDRHGQDHGLHAGHDAELGQQGSPLQRH